MSSFVIFFYFGFQGKGVARSVIDGQRRQSGVRMVGKAALGKDALGGGGGGERAARIPGALQLVTSSDLDVSLFIYLFI